MPGLDPGLHDEVQLDLPHRLNLWRSVIDCRIKPGNDRVERLGIP